MERTAKSGDTVKIHMLGKLDDGQVFYDSHKDRSVEFEIGNSNVLEGIQQAVIGMKPNETKNTTITPETGFGSHDDNLIRQIDQKFIPAEMDCKAGQNIQLKDKNENIIDGRIIDVLDDGIKVDLNHPLAGKSFSCELTLLEIQQS